MDNGDPPVFRGDTGVLLRVGNGDVIGYDATGLILRLSDRVVEDLRIRLGSGAAPVSGRIDPACIGDIDAWNVARHGDWLCFDARLPAYPHPRRFRRPVAGGDVVADAPGPLLAVLSLGGARRARGMPGRPVHPCHVVCPGDDVGAVGVAGVEPAIVTSALQQAVEVTLDTMVADTLLARRAAAGRALPLIVTRCETDASASASELASGMAIANTERAIDNLVTAAGALGTTARVLSIALDYGAEDVVSGPAAFVAGIRAVIDRLTAKLSALGLAEPIFVMRSDETGMRVREHWDLAVFPGDHRLVFAAPGYAFAHDVDQRPTRDAMAQMAEAEADAIEAALARTPWHCPRLLLAETCFPGGMRVVTDALSPLSVGADHGFALTGATIRDVTPDPDDPAAVRVTFDGDPAELRYAVGRTGTLCDADGRLALPAILPVGKC